VVDVMQRIVSADGTLSLADFQALSAVYEDELWRLTDRIYQDYQGNVSVEATAPVRLDLSDGQIADLNDPNKRCVTIPLKDVARFQYNEENIRIVDVDIELLDIEDVEGKYDALDYLDFQIEHAGVSKLQKDGQIFQFVHYKDFTQDMSPINWNERYFSDGLHVPVDRSDASLSLLYSLLNDHQAGNRDITLYARPGAWADLVLRSVPQRGNSGVLVIKRVRLIIHYDRVLRSNYLTTLQVLTEPAEVLPYFMVSSEDIYGRQDGVGAFCRTYTKGSSVAVEAPERFGNYVFMTWTWIDEKGTEKTQEDRHLSITSLGADEKLTANYQYVPVEGQ